MQMTWEQVAGLVHTVGQVWGVYQGGNLVGFYWIEECDRILHLHGLVVKSTLQGQGIGTEVLNMLAQRYTGTMGAIELGVHESNTRARALYERLGYRTVRRLDDLGFHITQKPLAAERTDCAT
jgi:ribosomal protein S18 acetylase RimI-like enzyme